MVNKFLTVVGLAYVVLAGWCALSPAKTSESVGFSLKPGSGQSEYFVIYGGLQLALGLFFLLPWIKPEAAQFSLLACVLIHGCIVLFRSISFFLYSDISTLTYGLAALEWLIFLAAMFITWRAP